MSDPSRLDLNPIGRGLSAKVDVTGMQAVEELVLRVRVLSWRIMLVVIAANNSVMLRRIALPITPVPRMPRVCMFPLEAAQLGG